MSAGGGNAGGMGTTARDANVLQLAIGATSCYVLK
jgi:hypothetical protein